MKIALCIIVTLATLTASAQTIPTPEKTKEPAKVEKAKEPVQYGFVSLTAVERAQQEEITSGTRKDVAQARKLIRKAKKLQAELADVNRQLEDLNRRIVDVQKTFLPSGKE